MGKPGDPCLELNSVNSLGEIAVFVVTSLRLRFLGERVMKCSIWYRAGLMFWYFLMEDEKSEGAGLFALPMG